MAQGKRKGAASADVEPKAVERVTVDAGAEETAASETQVPSPALKRGRMVAGFLACAAVAAVVGAGIATAALLPSSQAADQRAAALEEQLAAAEQEHPEDAAQAACAHEWRTLGLFEEKEAVTHTEEVPEITEVIDVPHTICNTCYAIVDGETEAHTAATGHAGFSTDVPIATTVVTQEAYTEEVVDEPAEQRFTPVLEWCPICGDVQAVPETEAAADGGVEDAGANAVTEVG